MIVARLERYDARMQCTEGDRVYFKVISDVMGSLSELINESRWKLRWLFPFTCWFRVSGVVFSLTSISGIYLGVFRKSAVI